MISASARPWETQGIKPVETPAWAQAAMGGDKVSKVSVHLTRGSMIVGNLIAW